MAGELSRKRAPEVSVTGSWWEEEGENIIAKLEEGTDCRVDMLVMNTFPPTFKRIKPLDIL